MGGNVGDAGSVGASASQGTWGPAEQQEMAAMMASAAAITALKTLLEEIVQRKNGEGQTISTGQAYMELMQVSGDMTNVKGTEAGIQGSVEGLGAVGTQVTSQIKGDLTTIENYFLSGGTIAKAPASVQAAAGNFADAIDKLQSIVKEQEALNAAVKKDPSSTPKPWMDEATCKAMSAQLSSIKASLSVAIPASTFDAQSVLSNICDFVNGKSSKQTTNLQLLSSSLNQVGGGFSAVSSVQSGLLTNTLSQVTMMLNTMRGTIQSIVGGERTFVSGQRAAS